MYGYLQGEKETPITGQPIWKNFEKEEQNKLTLVAKSKAFYSLRKSQFARAT